MIFFRFIVVFFLSAWVAGQAVADEPPDASVPPGFIALHSGHSAVVLRGAPPRFISLPPRGAGIPLLRVPHAQPPVATTAPQSEVKPQPIIAAVKEMLLPKVERSPVETATNVLPADKSAPAKEMTPDQAHQIVSLFAVTE